MPAAMLPEAHIAIEQPGFNRRKLRGPHIFFA
jgi:hypothetical protein